jgi:hypothetical protein
MRKPARQSTTIRPHPQAVGRAAGLAHDGDDLLDCGRIGGIATAFVARRAAGVEARHRRRRSAMASGIEQHRGHETLLTIRSAERGPPLAMESISGRRESACSQRSLWEGRD